MNEKQKIVTFILALMCNFTFLATAQNAEPKTKKIPECTGHKLGIDTLETIRQASALQDDYRLGDYANAYNWWHYIFTNAPCSYKQVYMYGPRLIGLLMDKPEFASRKKNLIDTLLLCYEAKIKYFPEEPSPNKGTYALTLNRFRPEQVELSVKLYKEYIEEVTDSVYDPNSITYYMKSATDLYKEKKYSEEQLYGLYDQLGSIVLMSLNKLDAADTTMKKYWESTNINLDRLMSPFLKCDKIDAIFQPKLKADPNNKLLVKQVLTLYTRAKCQDSENFMPLVEKSFELEPNADAAAVIGANFDRKGDNTKALYYYDKAAELYEDNSKKEDMYIKLADGYLSTNISTAKAYAAKALALNPNNGFAVIIQGIAFYKSKCGSEFEQAVAACVAVDYFTRAKNNDPRCTNAANNYIASYKKSFPTNEQIFFNNLKENDSYTIPCSGVTTTLRAR